MNDYLEVMLGTPHLMERYIHTPSNLIAFMKWFTDDHIGCCLKTRSEEDQIKILSFIYYHCGIFSSAYFQCYMVRFATKEPTPPLTCLVLAKNIINKVASISTNMN